MYHIHRRCLLAIISTIFFILPATIYAQSPPGQPLTSQELVQLVYQLPKHPEKRDEIVETIRQRGIGFPLTDGMRSLVATKSGSDAVLRRTLEEAERRRVSPTTEALPPETEAHDLLERCRAVTLAFANAMPDFVVRQQIKRSVAYGNTANWISQDTLSIGVSYRQTAGEEYRVLAVNGMPLGQEVKEGSDYSKYVGGATSSGVEYSTGLASIFKAEARATFKMVDTDIVLGRRTIVYEYVVKREFSNFSLKAGEGASTIVGSRGRVWIDRENDRVLRYEQIATEIPADFPMTAASSLIDYDWVTINEKPFLLPSRAVILMTSLYQGRQSIESRNEIRFRGYQKFGAELKVVDEVDDTDVPPPDKPEKPSQPVKTKPPDQR
jgi:hypothetical protein